MTDKNTEIETRIANAKTTDELLALAAEVGEPLTIEQAEKLLAEIKAESQNAAQSFAAEEDISDATLEAVAGGTFYAANELPLDFTRFTYRDGDTVYIGDNNYAGCQHWECHKGKKRSCMSCDYNYNRGAFRQHSCKNPQVRRYYGF